MKVNSILIIAMMALVVSCKTPSAVTSKSTASTSTEVNTKSKEAEIVKQKEVKRIVMTEALSQGKDLFDNNCGKCHRLYEANEFTKVDWAPILVEMQKKAHLNDAEMVSISNYIYGQL
jgi:nitrate/TMAO reductase-like tetraheme cytochrome c subunit